MTTLATAAPAAGVRGPQITVAPQQLVGASYKSVAYFNAAVKAGGILRGRIEITNYAGRRQVVAFDPVDALTAANLGATYQLRRHRIHGSTRWTSAGPRSVSIGPKRIYRAPIVARVPPGTKPGDYLSGVSIQVLNQRPSQRLRGKARVVSTQRYAIGLLVRVPGPRHPRITFKGASVAYEPAGVTFHVKARNAGNALLQGVYGTARVSRTGSPVLIARIGPGTFVTGTSLSYPLLAAKQQPHEGTIYLVEATLYYGGRIAHLVVHLRQNVRFGHAQAKKEQEFTGRHVTNPSNGVPWWAWVLIGLGVAVLAALLRRRRSGRRALVRGGRVEPLLEERLATLADGAGPLSILVISQSGEDRAVRRRLIDELRPRLRQNDVLAEDDERLVVILPNASKQSAEGQVEDLRRVFEANEETEGTRIGTATTVEPTTAPELLARADENATA